MKTTYTHIATSFIDVVKQTNLRQGFSLSQWIMRFVVVWTVCAFLAASPPALASEDIDVYCDDYVDGIIRQYKLNPSQNTIKRAMNYCTRYDTAKAKKVLLKSKKKPSGRSVRNVMGRCLDAAGGINANRTNVQIYKCNNSKAQKWTYTKKNEIRNVMGRCLDVVGGVNANRTNVQIYKCNGTKSQKWRFTQKREIRNVKGRCLDVAGGVNANGTNVQIFECNRTKSQQWR